MPRLPEQIWKDVRRRYETGTPMAQLARDYGVSETSIRRWKEKEGWEYGSKVVTDAATPVDEIATTAATNAANKAAELAAAAVAEQAAEAAAEYEARIAELEAKLAETQLAVEGIADVPDFATADDLLVALAGRDDDILTEAALVELGHINRKRMEKGQPIIDFNDDPGRLAQTRQAIAEELISRKTKFRSATVRQRVLKMVTREGNMVQVPVEQQINNEAAQAGISIMKARNKGMRIARPYRCQRRDCWNIAVTDSEDKLLLDGYCTETCRSTDPYLNAKVIEGLTSTDQRQILSGAIVSPR